MEKKKLKGYHGMIRDRMKPSTKLALKRCYCLGKYIDYVYDRFVRNKSVEQRSLAVKQILGLKAAVTFDEIQLWGWRHGKTITRKQIQQAPNEMRFFSFYDTIDWKDPKAKALFEKANGWELWFRTVLPYLENLWDVSKNILHESDAQVSAELKKRYKIDDETCKLIIKYFKDGKK